MDQSNLPQSSDQQSKTKGKFNKFKPSSFTNKSISSSPLSMKKTLTPMKASLLKPINKAASSIATSGAWVKNTLIADSDSDSDSDSDDLAAPSKNMAKSFVSFLTTASIYNGNLQDLIETVKNNPKEEEEEKVLQNANVNPQLPAESDQTVLSDMTQQDSSEIESIESIDSIDNETDLHHEQISQNNATSPQGKDLNKLARNMTLFELSIEKRLSKDTLTIHTKGRAVALGEKLRKVFDIKDDDILISEFSCWLLKDILLQGHIYLTKSHILFFAFLPKQDKSKTSNSGALYMESTNYLTSAVPKTLKNRYWAVLKGHTLSFYSSSTELYFPVLTIDLRYAVRADIITKNSDNNETKTTPKNEKIWFEVLTENKTFRLQADSSHAARSWVGILKKQIFACKNKGDCVTVKIPLQNVLDLDKTQLVESAKTLKIKVLENPDLYSLDDYFFMFLAEGDEAYHEICSAIQDLNKQDAGINSVLDSTSKVEGEEEDDDDDDDDSVENVQRKRSSTFSFPLRNVFFPRTSNSNSIPINKHQRENLKPHHNECVIERRILSEESAIDDQDEPSIPLLLSPDISKEPQESSINDGDDKFFIPGYATTARSLAQARSNIIKWTPNVSKLWSSSVPLHYAEGIIAMERGEDDPYLQNEIDTIQANKNFREHFVLSESESLVSSYYAYLQKNVPIYGKIYIGTTCICFRALVFGVNTKMIVPFKDVETCYKEKGFKFGYSGLVLVIHGHEELFFEFNSQTSRDDCEFLLLKQLDNTCNDFETSSMNLSGDLEKAKIKLLEDKLHHEAGLDIPIIPEDHPIFKTTLKPPKSFRFTCLTIGSRGDVQPYIALAKGLIHEGHQVRIATHLEFKEWIESHGIEFKEIAGSPTELMSLMVTHGSMNIGFIKEATSKFRGWLTELLATSWEACQGSEIIIESPSAFAGIHIAEALGIPYFRAFTMPWTRTRAYPHAFIVPEQKKGGSYNYLTHVLFENILWKGSSGQINKWREETLKISKTNLYQLQQNQAPFLYNVSPTVVPAPVDYNDWIKVTGYWFLDEGTGDYNPPKDLSKFMDKARKDGKKLVYIGFGSIVVKNPQELTQAVVDAVLDSDVRCILNKGWSERLGGSKIVEVDLPEQIFNSGAIPHDWLFQHIDCAVHHGGSGSTGASLRFGVPTIIKPFFGDQFFYASRVEDLGAGISLKKLNRKTLSKSLKECTTDQRIIAKAKAIGVRIMKENGVQTAIDCIYTEMEYARQLIVEKRKYSVNKYNEDHGIITHDVNEKLEAEVNANEEYNQLGGKYLIHDEREMIGEYDSWLLY